MSVMYSDVRLYAQMGAIEPARCDSVDPAIRPPRILVVERDRTDSELLHDLFTREGFQYWFALM